MTSTPASTQPSLLAAAHSHETDGYRRLAWSYDGSCLIAQSASHKLQTILLSPSIPSTTPSQASPLSISTSLSSASTLRSFAPWPYFTTTDPSTTLLLHSSTHLPIQLTHAFPPSSDPPARPAATYPLILPGTEDLLPAQSLAFTHRGAGFLAAVGRDGGGLAAFDVGRSGEGPVRWLRWPRSWRGVDLARDGAMGGMRGIASCVAVSAEGLVAVGTLRGCVGLYGAEGYGEGVAAWAVEEGREGRVTQVEWSGCGRYLYVGEGRRDGLRVYDVRVEGKMLGMLVGSGATSNLVQRFAVERTGTGERVWAGGMDGRVRVWEDCHSVDGRMAPSDHFIPHDDPVTSIVFDSEFRRIATCSTLDRVRQGREQNRDDAEDEADEETDETDVETDEETGETNDPMIKLYSNNRRRWDTVDSDPENSNT